MAVKLIIRGGIRRTNSHSKVSKNALKQDKIHA